MEVIKKIFAYISFKKPGPDEPTSKSLKMMHGINKISILMFLVGMMVLIIRWAVRS